MLQMRIQFRRNLRLGACFFLFSRNDSPCTRGNSRWCVVFVWPLVRLSRHHNRCAGASLKRYMTSALVPCALLSRGIQFTRAWSASLRCSCRDACEPKDLRKLRTWSFTDCTSSKEVTFVGNRTEVPANSLRGCTGIVNGPSLTGFTNIGPYVFHGRTALTRIYYS